MISKFAERVTKKRKERDISHHIKYYGGNIPFWCLVEHLTMGEIASFITFISREYRKVLMDKYFPGNKNELIVEWAKTIQTLRNTVAHFGRLYSKNFPYNPTFTDETNNIIMGLKGFGIEEVKHSLFGGIIIISCILFFIALPFINTALPKLPTTKTVQKTPSICTVCLLNFA